MKAGIAIDNWKLPIFERHLKNNGYQFEKTPGLGPSAMVLTVVTENLDALAIVVKAAQDECTKTGVLQ